MGEESITYQDWKTRQERKYFLKDSHPSELLTDLICPFDKTPILRWHDGHGSKGYNCVNCGLEYEIDSGNQEEVNDFAKQHYGEETINKVWEITKERNNLISTLIQARKVNLIDNVENLPEPIEDIFSDMASLPCFKQTKD